MHRIFKAAAVLIFISPALPVHAQYNALGFGVNDCSFLVATYEPSQLTMIFAWSTGYLTGFNQASTAFGGQTRDLNGLSPHLIVTRLLDHCTRNPQDKMLDGVRKIYLSAPIFSPPDAGAHALRSPTKQ
jgi:hypothetical protein